MKGSTISRSPVNVMNHRNLTRIIINRVEKRNAIDYEARQELVRLFNQLKGDKKTSAIILSSENNVFCAGQDLEEAKDFSAHHIEEWIDDYLKLYQAILTFPKPVIAAIDGCCVGAGLQMALLCDYRLGTPRSFYAMPELNDAIPCILGIWTLWEMIGRGRTMDMVLSNRRIPAELAQSWGLINRIVPTSELMINAEWEANLFASKSTLAFQLTKKRLADMALREIDDIAAYAKYAHMSCFETGDPAKAMNLFLERKKS